MMMVSGRGRGRVTTLSPTYRYIRQGHVFAGGVRAGSSKIVFAVNELKGGIQHDQVQDMWS